jgi:NAD kinase
MADPKIVMVTRKTRLESLIERFNSRGQAQFYIEHNGGNFSTFEREHDHYQRAVEQLRKSLQRQAKLQIIERAFLPNFLFAPEDLVVTIGIDGLVVNTAKYLQGQPLIAVNPDPAHIDGILLPFTVAQAPDAVRMGLAGQARLKEITMAQASLNNGQSLLAFNDLFIGVRSHVSARYRISSGSQAEDHSSSGLIVSTGAGATGWLSSIFNMANGLLHGFGQPDLTLGKPNLEWDANQLVFVVREPFISKSSAAGLVCGLVSKDQPLFLESHMPEGGVIFSDGVESDFLEFNAGSSATIHIAERKTRLVIG